MQQLILKGWLVFNTVLIKPDVETYSDVSPLMWQWILGINMTVFPDHLINHKLIAERVTPHKEYINY